MDALQVEAMFVRHKAAMSIVDEMPLEEDRLGLLCYVVHPTPDVLDASMRMAEERGVTSRSKELARLWAMGIHQPGRRRRAKKQEIVWGSP